MVLCVNIKTIMPCFVCFSLKSECWHKSAHHLIQGSLFDWPSQILEFTKKEIDTQSTTDFFRYIDSFVEQQL